MSLRIRHISRICLGAPPRLFRLFQPQHIPLTPVRNVGILSRISDNSGAYSKRIRRGRGPGSGKGKTSGRGHGGQKSRGKVPVGFEGGQTPARVAMGERGFINRFSEDMTALNLDRLQYWVDMGRLNPHRPITLLTLKKTGCIRKVRDGIKLLARGKEHLKTPLHLIVSRASSQAIDAVESLGGTITTRFYTKFSIHKILKGQTDPVHSRLFMPTPVSRLAAQSNTLYEYALPDPIKRKDLEYYRDAANRGYLSYTVPPGQSPSLFFKTPGLQGAKGGKKQKDVQAENKIW